MTLREPLWNQRPEWFFTALFEFAHSIDVSGEPDGFEWF